MKRSIFDVHVVDRYRWNRTKATLAMLCLIGAIGAVGGLEGEDPMPNPFLALCFVAAGIAVASRIDAVWGPKQPRRK